MFIEGAILEEEEREGDHYSLLTIAISCQPLCFLKPSRLCSSTPHHHQEKRQSSAHRTLARQSSLDLDSAHTATSSLCLTRSACLASNCEYSASRSSCPVQPAPQLVKYWLATPTHRNPLLALAHPAKLALSAHFLKDFCCPVKSTLRLACMTLDANCLASDVVHPAGHVPDFSCAASDKSHPTHPASDGHPSREMACHFLACPVS